MKFANYLGCRIHCNYNLKGVHLFTYFFIIYNLKENGKCPCCLLLNIIILFLFNFYITHYIIALLITLFNICSLFCYNNIDNYSLQFICTIDQNLIFLSKKIVYIFNYTFTLFTYRIIKYKY
jgi:hypothetical protein